MQLHQQIAGVKSKEDLAAFVVALRKDLETHKKEWENPTLEMFLEAMENWIGSMNGYYSNKGESPPESPTWQTFADILYASKIYE
jgi:hypothetical protein